MLLAGLAQSVELLAAAVALGDPFLGELARLDLLQDLLHRLLGGRRDDTRSTRDVAVLGGVADAVTHTGDALFVHEVDDELHFVQALEVRHLGLVTSLDQSLEPGLNERRETTAQHDLLTEQVGLGLFGEGGLDDAGAASADGRGVRQRNGLGVAGRVLFDGDESRNAAALGVGAAHEVAGTLRRDHDHVDTLRRTNALEADVEAVREGERLAGLHVLLDVRVVGGLLLGVGHGHHDDVGPLRGVGDRLHFETGGLGLGGRRRTFTQTDDHRDAALLQVERMSMALRSVADDRNLATLDDRDVAVGVVIHLCCHVQLAFPRTARRRASLSSLGRATRPVRWSSTMP